ncbi:transcription factor [Fusarium pseudoanthophilum]|uniref:Transcription factor n=1 Tax=Fusarium pseudoanthophilum TaxID=48495 RepID=A0A8H5KK13_9HYPO|nr:transcription factor [Fusarium pseudoanthophilum]
MSSKHPLRRSCAFCRARKIKCSNETICEACRKQGADCIYDFEPPRPKGRNLSFDSTKANNHLQVRSEHELPDSKRRRSCSANSASSMSPGRTQEDLAPLADGVESLAASLEQMFQDKFSQLIFGEVGKAQQQQSTEVRFTGLLPLIAFDLVASVGQRYSDLGSPQSNESNQFIRSGLSNDTSTNMFDNPSAYCSPLSTFSHRQRNQLIDVWFSAHPLTFLISKTLLLREIREDTCDEILMAVMLADASFVVGEDSTVARGHELLQWAKTQLQMRPCYHPSEDNDAVYSGVPTRVYKGVTTAQAMVLLAWNAISFHEFRRAICYIEVASKLVTEIKDCMSKDASQPNSSRINGVDVLDVEKEVVSNLWWTTYSLHIWTSIQAGVLPKTTPSTFDLESLPVTSTSSVTIQLDLVSENFNTLQKQKGNIREMRPLAQVVSTVAYLFSQTSDQSASNHGVGICKEAIRSFSTSTHDPNAKGQDDDRLWQLLVAFHHTMIIQFLFPKNGSFYEQVVVPAETVHQFCASVEQIIQSLSPTTRHNQHSASTFQQPLSKALCTLMDTCSRAFNLLRDNLGLSLDHSYFRPEWDNRLCSLASSLYTISKDERFYQGTTLRSVQKQIKSCARAFGSNSNTNALGLLEPSMNPMRSMSHSPQSNVRPPNGFIASNEALVDIPSPFQAEASSRVSSSMPSSSGSSTSVSTHSFTPFEEMNKWPINETFPHGIMSTNMNSPPIVQQGMWYSQAPPMVNFEAAGPVSLQHSQWAWPPTSGEEAPYISFQTLDMDET